MSKSHIQIKIDPATGDITQEGKFIRGNDCTAFSELLESFLQPEEVKRTMKPEAQPPVNVQNVIRNRR